MRSRTSQRLASLIASGAATLLAGCLTVRTPGRGEAPDPGPGEGIVIGRLRVFEHGLELTPWKRELDEILWEDPVIRLALLHVDSGRKRPDVPLSDEGRFAWILPAGTYLLYHTPSVDPPFNEGIAAFQVSAGSDPIDLGELHLAIAVFRPLSWELASYTLSHAEACAGSDEGVASFRRLHPGAYTVRKGSFVVDPDLSGLLSDWSREFCARILARHGLELESVER